MFKMKNKTYYLYLVFGILTLFTIVTAFLKKKTEYNLFGFSTNFYFYITFKIVLTGYLFYQFYKNYKHNSLN